MAVAYKCYDGSYIGTSPLTNSDATAVTQLGTIVRGVDTSTGAYGEAEFEYVKFTGTVAAGDAVVVDRGGKTCVQASTSAAKGLIGISMAAQSSGTFGWVLVRGIHDGANVATGVTAGTALGVSATAGRLAATSTGNKVDGGFERVSTSASNVGVVEFEWPAWTGNG